MPNSYVVKTLDDSGYPIGDGEIFKEIKKGRARIGWSYADYLDLRLIQQKIANGQDLNNDEYHARRCLGFLTRVEIGDYLLYPHQPERHEIAVCEVTGDYDYSSAQEGINQDFRSFRPCKLINDTPVNFYDEIVSSQLRMRLGKPGRISRVYDLTLVPEFLENIDEQGKRKDDSITPSTKKIHSQLRRNLPDLIRREFSGKDLSQRFCVKLFEQMGYTLNLQEGPSEAGSDIVLTIGSPMFPTEFQVGVQVFAYEGIVEQWAFEEKLNQLIEGWEKNSLDYGVLLTTGHCSESAIESLRIHNHDNQDRKIRLIDGDDLANLFLQYFPPEIS